jgi:hypothetical protein
MLWLFDLQEISPQYPLAGRLGGLDVVVKRKFLSPLGK